MLKSNLGISDHTENTLPPAILLLVIHSEETFVPEVEGKEWCLVIKASCIFLL